MCLRINNKNLGTRIFEWKHTQKCLKRAKNGQKILEKSKAPSKKI